PAPGTGPLHGPAGPVRPRPAPRPEKPLMTRLDQAGLPHGSASALSHVRQWRPGVVQEVAPAGVLDLGPGYIEPALLPVHLLKEAYGQALAEYGAAALGY